MSLAQPAGWRIQTSRFVRRRRRGISGRLRRVILSRPVDDHWADRLDRVELRLAGLLKRVELRLRPRGAVSTPPPPRTGPIAPVHEPLVLLAQMGRSGGTLLLRLFDGHPECRVVPHELGPLLPARDLRPAVDRAARVLTPRTVHDWHRLGMQVGKKRLTGERKHTNAFDLHPELLADIYAEVVRASRPRSDRETLDAYFTAYFNAWRHDGDDGVPHPSRWILGFEPGALVSEPRMRRFDANYPDGRVLCILRDPWSWFASARRWSPRFAHPGVALRRWIAATDAALAYGAARPGRIRLIAFDDLVLDTQGTMTGVADFLEIGFEEVLLSPTFDGLPVDHNSSFDGGGGGVSAAPATDRRDALSEEETELVGSIAAATWERARTVLAEEGAR